MDKTTTYRRPATEEAREKRNAYHRAYNHSHPERVKAWRLNQAKKLLAAAEANQISNGDRQEGGEEE